MRDQLVKFTLRAFGRLHARWFRTMNGRFSAGIGRIHFLLLITRGRKSGLERVTPLTHAMLGDSYVIAASYAGTKKHPHWYWNLRGQDEVSVEIKGAKRRVQVIELEGARRAEAWKALVDIFPMYEGYKRIAGREIPVIELRPM